jgi:CheY-like chemotaxis protein
LGRVLSRVLAGEGRTLAHAANAAQALELAQRQSPHLVLLDGRLRDRHAVDLARELRSRHRGLPVILMTDYHEKTADDLVGAGCCTRVLSKGIDLPELRQAIDAALNPGNRAPA